jgi:cellulose synthase/poly-beta-1,6-N-acetylglucosamine synthase-like glycosyltransferase
MLILLYITGGLLLLYGTLIAFYFYAWNHIPRFTGPAPAHETKITVIVPARNEADNIVRCLRSLTQQDYPKHLLEIIIVNDHSTDSTEALVKSFPAPNLQLINLADHTAGKKLNSYKKKALEVAIAAARGDLIVTTDADCIANPGWIRCLAAYHTLTKAVLLAAPVKIASTRSLLSIFQSLDFLTLQGITGASVASKFNSMCNGANLAYEKKVFYEVGGFAGIDNIASGDDMLLMHKIVTRYPSGFYFVKEQDAIVTTDAVASVKAFLHQRIRWASKADKYNDKRIFPVLLMVYLVNVSMLVFLAVGLWNLTFLTAFIILIIVKTIIEFPFVFRVSLFFNQQHLMVYFPFLQPLHIMYTVVAGWLGRFGSYEWKSRKVK